MGPLIYFLFCFFFFSMYCSWCTRVIFSFTTATLISLFPPRNNSPPQMSHLVPSHISPSLFVLSHVHHFFFAVDTQNPLTTNAYTQLLTTTVYTDMSAFDRHHHQPSHLDLWLGLDEDDSSHRTHYKVRNSIFFFSWYLVLVIWLGLIISAWFLWFPVGF